MDVLREVNAAEARIRAHVRETPIERSSLLSDLARCNAYLKCENVQHTGSFKFRGAISKLLALDERERARGVVAASTGNHGKAVALAASRLGCPATIFAPATAEAGKLEAIRAYDVDLRVEGDDCACVIGGQGTIGVELEQQLPDIDAVVVSVGGGGLIAGVGGYLKACKPGVRVIGASPRNSAVMHASLQAGHLVELESLPTLSDGTAGGVEAGAITFELCRDLIDDFVLVSEEDIAAGVRSMAREHDMVVEGAAGTAVAALRARRESLAGLNVAVILCGGNIDPATHEELL